MTNKFTPGMIVRANDIDWMVGTVLPDDDPEAVTTRKKILALGGPGYLDDCVPVRWHDDGVPVTWNPRAKLSEYQAAGK